MGLEQRGDFQADRSRDRADGQAGRRAIGLSGALLGRLGAGKENVDLLEDARPGRADTTTKENARV